MCLQDMGAPSMGGQRGVSPPPDPAQPVLCLGTSCLARLHRAPSVPFHMAPAKRGILALVLSSAEVLLLGCCSQAVFRQPWCRR